VKNLTKTSANSRQTALITHAMASQRSESGSACDQSIFGLNGSVSKVVVS
jgi:hypothetical protein